MNNEAPLFDAVLAAPESLSPRQIYADWLEERGDARGEYLRMELQLAAAAEGARANELRGRMLALRGRIDPAWIAALEQPGVMLVNPAPFPLAWCATPLEGLRDHKDNPTYAFFGYRRQPDLPTHLFRGDYQWLRDEGRLISDEQYRQRGQEPPTAQDVADAQQRRRDELAKQEELLGFELPAAYREFMLDTLLVRRVHSVTGCYFCAEEIVDCPLGGDGKLIRFHTDSQGCEFWSLYLHPSGGHYVVVSWDWGLLEGDWGLAAEEDEEWDSDEVDEVRDGPALYYCAPTIEAFIYRVWIESEVWSTTKRIAWDEQHGAEHDPPFYLQYARTALNDHERAYIDALRREYYPNQPAQP